MSAPFRDLFVELPAAVFEALQGIAEAAVRQSSAPPNVPVLGYRPPWWLTEYAWRRLAERWGVVEVAIRRRSVALEADLGFRRRCGHAGRGRVDERALMLARPVPEVIEVLDRAFDCAEHDCCCMEPAR